MDVLAVVHRRTGRIKAGVAVLFCLFTCAWAQEALVINLRSIRSHQEVKDANDFIVAKSYKTPRGEVVISPTTQRGKITGAVVKLGSIVIARARVLSMSQEGAEIEETQFRPQDPNKPVYVGTLRYNGFRDRITAATPISGAKIYEVFVDWDW